MIIFDADCAEKFTNTTAYLINANGEHQRANSCIYDLADESGKNQPAIPLSGPSSGDKIHQRFNGNAKRCYAKLPGF